MSKNDKTYLLQNVGNNLFYCRDSKTRTYWNAEKAAAHVFETRQEARNVKDELKNTGNETVKVIENN